MYVKIFHQIFQYLFLLYRHKKKILQKRRKPRRKLVGFVEKLKILQNLNVVINGYVMMKINIFHIHLLKTAVTETMRDTHFVILILVKNTLVNGKTVICVK